MLIKHGQRKTLISTEKSALLKSFLVGSSCIDIGISFQLWHPITVGKNFLIFILKGLGFRCYKDVFLVAYNHGSQIQKKVQN